MATHTAPSCFVELAQERRIHYTDHPAMGPLRGTLVFIHGSGPGASGWSNFKHNVDGFQAAGFRCVVYDQWGYGKTDKPTDVDYTLDFFVWGLIGLMDELAIDDAILVGNSLGGAVALGAALAHPTRVSSLVLMAPGGIEARETYFAMEGIQEMVKFPMGSPEFTRDVLGKLLELLVFDPTIVDDALLTERWQTLQTQNSQVLASMAIPDLSPRLHEIGCPTMVFWGTEDRFCPAQGVWKLLNGIPNTQAHLMNRCGHWVMTEYPSLFNARTIAFLEERGQ